MAAGNAVAYEVADSGEPVEWSSAGEGGVAGAAATGVPMAAGWFGAGRLLADLGWLETYTYAVHRLFLESGVPK